MALHKLLVDDFYDDSYKLFAVHCGLEDYRMAYLLNQYLHLKLKRKAEDIDVTYLASSYSLFEWKNKAEYMTWNLISNTCKKEEDSVYSTGMLFKDDKALKTYHLISEHPNVDYFIKLSDQIQNVNEKAILSTLQVIPQVITGYAINPHKIKSKDYLIF